MARDRRKKSALESWQATLKNHVDGISMWDRVISCGRDCGLKARYAYQ